MVETFPPPNDYAAGITILILAGFLSVAGFVLTTQPPEWPPPGDPWSTLGGPIMMALSAVAFITGAVVVALGSRKIAHDQ